MPRPEDTPDVKASKALAYILRHGADKEGLYMRRDGYIKLGDVLARPKMREVDVEMVLRLVAENAKQRFEVFYGYDPSPPPPKKLKKGQQAKKVKPALAPLGDGFLATEGKQSKDAAAVDDATAELSSATLSPGAQDLPLVSLPGPSADIPSDPRGEYFIRASQGHSLKVDADAHLEPIKDEEEGRRKAGLLVHGTKIELWDTLLREGLSRMNRQHIHLAPALTLAEHPIMPRPNSTLLIYLDLPKLLEAGIPVYVSANGVVLTPGNANGVVESRYWKRAERVKGGVESGERTVIWEDGHLVQP